MGSRLFLPIKKVNNLAKLVRFTGRLFKKQDIH